MSFGNEFTLGEALGKMLEKLKLDDDAKQHNITKAWEKLMPMTIKKHITQLYFHKGTLFIQVKSSPVRQELFMSRHQLKKRINEELGENFIQSIILK